jgi:hypothetical protein
MSTLTVTPTEALAAFLGLFVFVWLWRASARRARAAARAARAGTRLVSLAGRIVFNAALIVAAQWVTVLANGRGWLLLAVLGLPALLASYTLTRALTVTTIDLPGERRRRGGRR